MTTRRATKRAEVEKTLREAWDRAAYEEATGLIAIDPGDRWTGVAFFAQDEDDAWFCQDAQEFEPPQEFEDALADLILNRDGTPPPIIVYEKWRLYEDHAMEQTGSEFEACQHIGVMKFLVRTNNDHFFRHETADKVGKMLTCELGGEMCAKPENRPQEITIFKQGAEIKKPTRGILRKKGIKSVAKPISAEFYHSRDHIVDAELHGWKYILDVMKGKAAS